MVQGVLDRFKRSDCKCETAPDWDRSTVEIWENSGTLAAIACSKRAFGKRASSLKP